MFEKLSNKNKDKLSIPFLTSDEIKEIISNTEHFKNDKSNSSPSLLARLSAIEEALADIILLSMEASE